MNIKLIKLLAVACGVLMVVIVAEWQYARYSKQQLFAKLEAKNEQDYTPGKLPEIELTRQAEDSYVELTSRPLFIEGRRPRSASEIEEEGEQIAVPLEKFDWELDGVYIHEDTTMALFSSAKKAPNQEKHLKKSEGEVIEGWTLLKVSPDKVVIELDGKQHELMLRKPKPTKSPAQKKPNSRPIAKPKPAPQVDTRNPFLRKSTQ